MANGGELGYHGIITNPLSPSSVNYGEKYVSYKTWKDKAAMKAGLSELIVLSTNSFLKHKNQSTFHHQIFFRKKDER